MNSIYKKISSHGSINIPAAMRREMGIEPKDPMEVMVTEGNEIRIKPYLPRCIFCGTTEDVSMYRNKGICPTCKQKLQEL